MGPEELYTPEQAKAYRLGEQEELIYCPDRFDDPDLQHHFELGYYSARAEADYAEYVADSLEEE